MPQYITLPNGASFPLLEGESPEQAWAVAQQKYPEAFGQQPAGEQPKGGFGAAFKAGVQNIIGQGALTAGKAGLLDPKRAEQIAQEREAKARSIFKPTEESFLDAPVQNTLELLGGSAPYALAPLAAGAGAAALGAPAAVGAGAAGLASLAQFTGSNLERQMDAQGKSLEQTSGTAAVGAAIPQAALDVIGFRFIPGIGKLFGAAGEKVTVDTARQLAAQTAKQIAADYAKATGRAMTAEGLTETMQQVLERAQAQLSVTDPEARQEMLQSFFGGALLGGVLAPAGRAVERSQMTSQSKELQAEKARTDRSAGSAAQPPTEPALLQEYAQLEARLQQEPALKKPQAPKNATPAQQLAYRDALAQYEQRKAAQEQLVARFLELRERVGGKAAELSAQQQRQRMAAEADPRQMGPQFVQPAQQQIPGVEGELRAEPPARPADPEAVQAKGSQLLEERRVLEQRLQEYQGAIGEANAARDFDGAQRALDMYQRTQQGLNAIDSELNALGVKDPAVERQTLIKQLDKLERKLAAQSGPGTDPAAVAKLFEQRRALQAQLRDVGGPQAELDLGAPRELSDPVQNYERAQGQQAAAELAQRDELLQNQRPAPDDTRMDLFQESTDQVEELRATGEPNFDYLDPIFEKAFSGGERAVAVPDTIQPVPQAAQMIARLDALEQQSKTGSAEQRAQALQELAQLSGEGSAPFVQSVRNARLTQERALMDLQATIEDLRRGVTLGGPQSALASSTRAGLYKQLAAQRGAYIRAMLDEAAVRRRAEGAPALTRDEALKAASAADAVLDEMINRGTVQPGGVTPAVTLARPAQEAMTTTVDRLAVEIAKERVFWAQQGLRAATSDADRVAAEKELAARQLEFEQARRAFANTPKRLEPGPFKWTMGDPRALEERPLGSPRAAQAVFDEQLQEVRSALNTARPAARADRQLLRRQDAKAEAAKVAEAAGDTAQTPAGRDRREQDFVEQQLDSLEQRGKGVGMLRSALEKHPTRDVRAAVRTIAERLDLGQQVDPSLRRQLADAISASESAALDTQGQLDIFDTGTVRGEQQQLRQRQQELQAELAQIPTSFKSGAAAAAAYERSNILQRALIQLEQRLEQAQGNERALQGDAQRFRSELAFLRATPENFRRALESSPEVKKARAALERFRTAAQAGFATLPKQPSTGLQKALTPAPVAPAQPWLDTPAVREAQAAVDRQRAILVDTKKQAVLAAVEADQKARDVVYGPQLGALRKQIDAATEELARLRSWPFAESPEAADATAPVQELQRELRRAQRQLSRLARDAVARADSTMIQYAIAEDAVVQFEKAVLMDMEAALQEAITSANPSVIEQRRIAAAAQAQRERVAVEEAAQRAAADQAAKNRRDFENRLRAGFDLPALKPSDRLQKQELRRRIASLDAAIAAPDTKVQAIQAQLVELNAQPDPDRKVKRKIYDVTRRLEQAQDAAANVREQLEQQRDALLAQLEGHDYLTEQDRAEAAWRERVERERGTALDALKAQPFAPRARATSPVYREASQEPRALRTGSPESMAGENVPAPKGLRARESTKPQERNTAISAQEMQIANAEAARLKAMSPAERRKQVKEAEAVAKELRKASRAPVVPRSRAAAAVEEFDADTTDVDETGLDFGVGDALFSAQRGDFYLERQTTPLSDAAVGEASLGRADMLLERLASEGSTPFVRELAQRLFPVAGDVRIQVLPEVLDRNGRRVEGVYRPGTNEVLVPKLDMSEEVVLHELTHAATMRQLEAAPETLTPEQRAARQELQQLFDEVAADPTFTGEYAQETLPEFVAELMSNEALRQKIDARGNVLQRIYRAILRMLGLRDTDSAQAVQAAYRLFAPAKPYASKYAGVASVLRGRFLGTEAEFNADIPERVREVTQRTIGRDLTLVDKIQAHIAGFRTTYIDRFDGIDKALRQGVARGLIPELQAFQTQYFLRFGEHRNQFVEQAASNGVPQLIKHGDGTFTIETPEGEHANLSKIAKILHDANVGNEQATEQLFTQYLAVLRAEQEGIGYEKLNFSQPLTAADAAEIKRTVAADPARKRAFEAARAMYREYNHKLLDFMQQTDALSKDEVARLKAREYVPYYRNRGGVVELVVGSEQPVRIGNIVDQPYLKELVGDDAKILPFFTGALQNTSMLIDMALRNQQTKDVAMTLRKMDVATIGRGDGPTDTRDIVRFKVNGERMFARIENSVEEFGVNAELLVKGMEGIKTTLPTFLRALQIPANWLRKMVTRAPAYAVRQIIREPINAWLVSGANFTPVVSSVRELTKIMQGKSAAELALQRSGAISSNVITGDVQDQVRILRDISDGKTTFDKVMAAADKFAMQGDAATRAVLYDTYRKQGMTHMQALLGSLESMNFARRGVSPSMHMMSQLIPFFNAQVQGMDVIYRALSGNAPLEQQMNVRRQLFKRGMMVAAATVAYAAAMQDDEAYKNATPEQRALNWFLPLPGLDEPVRVPIPFELGYLFKVLPETIINVAAGDQKVGDAVKLYAGLLHQTVPFGIPQAVKPAIEVMTNHSFFTGEAVETGRERSLQTEERMRQNTTEVAKLLGQAGVLSPVQVDHLIRGYFGGLGVAMASIPNFALRPLNTQDMPELPEKTLSQMPLLGPLFQPRDGRASINAAYDEIESWQQAHNTFQNLLATGRRADAAKFAQDYSRDIALNSVGGAFKQQMGELAKLRRAVTAGPGTPEEKRRQIDAIKQIEIRLSQRMVQLGQGA